MMLAAAKAAPVLAGEIPTLNNTAPGVLYFTLSINALEPHKYPPQLANALLKVPIQISTAAASI